MNKNLDKEITIAEISEKLVSTGNTVVKIVALPEEGREKGDKFQFWKLHKGVDSEAYKQMQKGVKVGSKVMIEYTEEDKEFTNEKDQLVKFKERTIWKFKGDEHGVPHVAEKPLESEIDANTGESVATIDLDKEIKPEDLPF